ncbi:hypothetical protein AURANDRAFT_62237 [Aureococcus anophagefferens]|uniref:Tudor domain-containing protein n=1 Tax=Aureococcus anophagefferens TaxID=44056 RepID=F0Y144_AURAN|nr:hypothetical protein AURANDRAFT_62237 [Aureococcus anophagefferens]EGB11005.1 hypothetical protein AURANDRAFT_62237 [Aureococcus anophagefferens]|eukprot:XP_009034565.1 hypothetical protein AURANDRAFT_62237 [Aureococcus anophagefferens]
MGAGASAKEAPLESSDPEEQAIYARLKARYDGESPALGSDVERDALYATLKKEYDQWLSDGHDAHPHAISAGDVVQAPVDGLYFEGVVTHVDAEGAHVDFGDHDIQVVDAGACRRVLSWSVLEVGDTVQVREEHSHLLFLGTVDAVNFGDEGEPPRRKRPAEWTRPAKRLQLGEPRYDVAYDGEADVEADVAPSRVRKVRSARSTAVKRWKEAFHAVVACHAFNRASLPFAAVGGRDAIKCAIDHHHGPGDDDAHHGDDDKAVEDTPVSPRATAFVGGEPLVVGDIVTCRPPGEDLWCEGVVTDADAKRGRALIHITNEDTEEHAGKDLWIAKKFHWHTLEVGDRVEAQPRDEALWYSAIVLEVTRSLCDGHLEYTVQYTDEHHHNDDDEHHGHGHPGEDDEHEIEHHLPPAKLRKVQSGRSLTNVQRFKLAGRMVSAMRAFRASGFTHKHHDGGADAKADSKADAAVAALAAKGDAPADEKK